MELLFYNYLSKFNFYYHILTHVSHSLAVLNLLLFSCSVISTLWDPMDCSTRGFPVHHQLLEVAQTHVHWVGDAIQPSHPLSAPCPPSFNLSQLQGLFQWVSSSHQVAKVASVLPMSIQNWFLSGLTGLIPLQYEQLSRVFFNTTVQKHKFFSTQSFLLSSSHTHTWLLEKP